MRTVSCIAFVLIAVLSGTEGSSLLGVTSHVAASEAAPSDRSDLGSPPNSATLARSLIPNGSFDRDTSGWRSVVEPSSSGHADWSPHVGHEGEGALHIAAAPGEVRQFVGWTCTLDSLSIGRRLRVSAWVKGVRCQVAPVATITIVGSERNLAAETSKGIFKLTGDFDWTRLEVLVPVPDGGRSAFLSLFLPGAGEAWFDDLEAVAVDSLTAMEGASLLRVHSAWEYSLRAGAAPVGSPQPGPKLLLALPLDYREQVPLSFELTTRPAGRIQAAHIYQDRPGAWIARVELAPLQPSAKVVLEWTSVVLVAPRSFGDFPRCAPLPSEWPAAARPWLAATSCAEANDPRIGRIAATIRDTTQDVRKIIEGTLLWMSGLKTDERELCSVFDAVQALDHRGSCVSRANLATALLRANGIPARVLGGFPSRAPGPMQCHFVVEAYVPGCGWFPFDPTTCRAPISPSDQIQVSIVPTEYEDQRAVQRRSGARGLPYLSIDEFLGDSRMFLTLGAFDRERSGAVIVNRLRRYPSDAPEWDRTLEMARVQWGSWLAGVPTLDAQGMLRTPLASDSLVEVPSLSALLDRLQSRQ